MSATDGLVSFTVYQAIKFKLVQKKDKTYYIIIGEKTYYCPVEVAMDVIGGKWKGVVIWYLQEQTLRFSELKKCIITISEKALIRELRELEQAGIVTRTVYAQVPPRVEYSLSEFGRGISSLISEISKFGEVYAQRFGQVVEQLPQK